MNTIDNKLNLNDKTEIRETEHTPLDKPEHFGSHEYSLVRMCENMGIKISHYHINEWSFKTEIKIFEVGQSEASFTSIGPVEGMKEEVADMRASKYQEVK